MKTLTINVTRKNGKYVGTLEECLHITAESDLLDKMVHAMKVSIMQYMDKIGRGNLPEALKDGPLKFRICGEEEVFSNVSLERDTQSRLALNQQLDRMNEHLERISPMTLEDVALHIFCHFRPLVTKSLFCPDEERMEQAFDLAERFLLHKKNRYHYYWKRQFGIEE